MLFRDMFAWGARPAPPARFTFAPVTRSTRPPIRLAVAAIVKDEAACLEEWIEFHALLGVGHFIVYDNGSTDGTRDLLEEYRREGLVSWYPWPRLDGWRSQHAAYAHANAEWRERCRWMACIDLDEFLFPCSGDSLIDALVPFEGTAAIGVTWRNFGHGGHHARPHGLVIENYRQRLARVPSGIDTVLRDQLTKTKTIADPCRVTEMKTHRPIVNGPYAMADDALRLNHYFTRSREEFDRKVMRGAAYKPPGEQQALATRRVNVRDAIERDPVEDLEIQRFVPALKERLARRHAPARQPVSA